MNAKKLSLMAVVLFGLAALAPAAVIVNLDSYAGEASKDTVIL